MSLLTQVSPPLVPVLKLYFAACIEACDRHLHEELQRIPARAVILQFPLSLVEVTQFAPRRRHEPISDPAGAAVERFSIHPLLPTQPDFIRMCDAPRSIRDVVDVADAKFTLLREFAHRRAEKLVELG